MRLEGVRRGLTLIELLVVLFVIGLLVALLLPAVLGARESARRTQCAANMKMLALATRNYEGAFNAFPPGRMKTFDPRFAGSNPPCTARFVDKGPLVFLLPFMEQEPLFNAINQTTSIFAAENTTVHPVAVAAYACPSDFLAGQPRALDAAALPAFRAAGVAPGLMVFASYGGSTGSFEASALPLPRYGCRVDPRAVAQNDGCFPDAGPINSASVGDGLSHTILWLERSIALANRTDGAAGVGNLRSGWYVSGNWGDSLLTTFYPPDAPRVVAPAATTARFNAASSGHPGGTNVAMADGSVRFVQASVDTWAFDPYTGRPAGIVGEPQGFWTNVPRPGLWQRLATRSGGEVADD